MINAARALMRAQVSAEAEPWRWVPWLPLQLRYLQCTDSDRLMRAGNQAMGKSTACLADLAASALGQHPFRRSGARSHGEYWIIAASWSESVVIQNKLHDLLPPARMHPDTVFRRRTGFRGTNPAVEVKHLDGEYSIIHIKTSGQDALDLASATISGALFDEVPRSEGVYSEVSKRVLMTGGWVSLGLTPINRPVGWLRDRVDERLITDIHARMTPEQLIPVGSRRPRRIYNEEEGAWEVCDEEWIRRLIAKTASHEVPVRIHGEWECRVMDRYFTNFRSSGEGTHVHHRVPEGEFRLLLGIDHGDRPGKQCAVLVAVNESGRYPVVYVLDEYSDDEGTATPEDDAQAILSMLEQYGWSWGDLDEAWGDRVHLRGRARQKSNRDLAAHLAHEQRIPREAMRPSLRTVKRGAGRGAGSLTVGSRWLFNVVSRGNFGIHPRCTRLITAMDNWDFRDTDHKDPIDALRYALDSYIFGLRRRKKGPKLRVR